MDQSFQRRPNFDAGHDLAWTGDEDPVRMVEAACAAQTAQRKAQECGRWVPPTGIPQVPA